MFLNKTVFILGAGASWHYGYPTGEVLVKKVIDKARFAGNFFRDCIHHTNQLPEYLRRNPHQINYDQTQANAMWKTAQDECEELIDRLKQINPLVIDYFMGQNPSLQPIG